MKLQITLTKFLISALVVLGLVLPVSAEPMPHPYNSMDNNFVDWWDEFDQDIYPTSVPATHKSVEEYTLSTSQSQSYDTAHNNVVDWWDEFSYADAKTPDLSENTRDHAMPMQANDSSWMYLEDW